VTTAYSQQSNERASGAMSLLPCQEIYLKSARVVQAAGDNSCLYHSLSHNLNHEDLYSNVYDETNNGFTLRHRVNDYIRDNLSKVVWITPEVCETFAEAIVGDGYNTSDYYARMSLNSSWGGMIEICAVAEMFHVNIQIFERNADPKRRFKWIGTFKYTLNDVLTTSLYILYTGNNHYDSLLDIVNISKNISGVSVGGDNVCQLSTDNKSSSSKMMRLTQIRDAESVPSKKDLQGKQKSNDVLVVTTDSNTTETHKSKRLASRSIQDGTAESPLLESNTISVESPVLRERRSLYNERKRIKYNERVKSFDRRSEAKKQMQISNTDRDHYCDEYVESPVHTTDRVASRSIQDGTAVTPLLESNTISVESPLMREHRSLYNERKRNKYNERSEEKKQKQISNTDRDHYCDQYDEKSRFIACAMCGIENSQTGSMLIEDNVDLVAKCGIREAYEAYISISDESTMYEKIFIEEVKKHFVLGLIKGLKSICATCRSEMRKNNKEENETTIMHMPKMVNFKGLFTGSIPIELSNLTAVEDSMINIYSAISKVCLAGGKHYKLNSGTCYTIVNDLASVAKKLPRMPTIESIAIIRHKNTKISNDYTYRPFTVFKALTWLKNNNHLYENIELDWPIDVLDWQNQDAVIEPPYIELTDQEETEINEEHDIDAKTDERPSTNPGKNAMHL
jgi:OTU-like cysteine protease